MYKSLDMEQLKIYLSDPLTKQQNVIKTEHHWVSSHMSSYGGVRNPSISQSIHKDFSHIKILLIDNMCVGTRTRFVKVKQQS